MSLEWVNCRNVSAFIAVIAAPESINVLNLYPEIKISTNGLLFKNVLFEFTEYLLKYEKGFCVSLTNLLDIEGRVPEVCSAL